MSTGEMVDTALRLYQRSAWTVLKLTTVPVVLCYAAFVFLSTIVWPTLFTTSQTGGQSEATDIATALLFGLLVAGPLFCLGLGWSSGIVVSVAKSILHGEKVVEADAAKAGWTAMKPVAIILGKMLLASAAYVGATALIVFAVAAVERTVVGPDLFGLISGLVALFLSVIGVIGLPIAWHVRSLVPVLAVIENAKGRDASKRSRFLMRFRKGHPGAEGLALAIILLMLLVGIPLWGSLGALIDLSGGLTNVLDWNPVPGLGQFLSVLIEGLPAYVTLWLLLPFWATAMTVLYYDRIVRFETYDVNLMLEDIHRQKRRSVLLR